MAPRIRIRRGATVLVAAVAALTLPSSDAVAGVFSLPVSRPSWSLDDYSSDPSDLATLPDGSFVYFRDGRVLRVSPTGRRTVLAGKGYGQDVAPTDGARATAVSLSYTAAVAISPDGSVLVASGDQVWRVRQDGTIWLAAGARPDGTSPNPVQGPAPGDGGPAREARLYLVSDVMALADGGFLVAEAGRVRRVHPDGTIDTAAGSCASGHEGEGGPATDACIGVPTALAGSSDGGYLISSGARVWHVRPDGTIHIAAGTGRPGFAGDGGLAVEARLRGARSITPLPAGGFLIADTENHRLRQVTPDGRIKTVAGNGRGMNIDVLGPTPEGSNSGFFTGQGRSSRAATLSQPFDVVPDPLGGWLIAHETGISHLTDAGSRRPGVAIVGVDAGKRRLEFVSATPGRLTLELRHSGRVIARHVAHAVAGRNRIRLPHGRRGPHTVSLTVKNQEGLWDDDRLGLVLGGVLSKRLAQTLAGWFVASGASLAVAADKPTAQAADGPYEAIGACKRFTPRRVDCEYYDLDTSSCLAIYSMRLRRNGLVHKRDYACGRRSVFTRQPRRLGKPQPVPLL